MNIKELVDRKAIRTRHVEYADNVIDRSCMDEPILVVKVTDSHIIYKSCDSSVDTDKLRILTCEWIDNNWVDYDELINLQATEQPCEEGGDMKNKDTNSLYEELFCENIKLKEAITALGQMNKELSDACDDLCFVPQMVHSNLRMINLMCSEQVKAQRGEDSSQDKFKDAESFAVFLEAMTSTTIKYLEDKYNISERLVVRK